MNILDLKEFAVFSEHWPHVASFVEKYIIARTLESAKDTDRAQATQELSKLLDEFRKLQLPVPEPVSRPQMKPLNSMSKQP